MAIGTVHMVVNASDSRPAPRDGTVATTAVTVRMAAVNCQRRTPCRRTIAMAE